MYNIYNLTAYKTLLCKLNQKPETLLDQCFWLLWIVNFYTHFIHCRFNTFSCVFIHVVFVFLYKFLKYRMNLYIFVILEKHFLCRKGVLYMLVVISFVLGFISSVVAGIVANYIFDQLKG